MIEWALLSAIRSAASWSGAPARSAMPREWVRERHDWLLTCDALAVSI